MKTGLLAAVLALAFRLEAQDTGKLSTAIPVLNVTQGCVLESISGEGFANSTGGFVSNIGSGNPASIQDFESPAFGVSWQFETVIDQAMNMNISYERAEPLVPQSLGLVVPLKSFRVAFGFSQRYNSFLDLGAMERTTVLEPEGTGEIFRATKKSTLYGTSCLLSRSFGKARSGADRFDLGIQITYNRLNLEDRIFHSVYRSTAGNWGWTAGFRYGNPDRFQAGVFYERNTPFHETVRFGNANPQIQVDIDSSVTGNNPNIPVAGRMDFILLGKLPDRLHAGYSGRIAHSVRFLVDLTQVYWKQVDKDSRNNLDVSAGLVFEMNRRISLSAGWMNTARESIDGLFDEDRLNADFFLAGMRLRSGHASLDLACVTAAPGSGDWRKQTIGKAGLGFQL